MIEISIIIATFNAAKTLSRCLDSIVDQLTDEIELILIDGDSTDSTNEIIKSYGNKIAIHISEKDGGIYDAWNKGIKLSHAPWVSFIGADDVLLPMALSYYLDVIHNTPNIESYDYICAYNKYIDENENDVAPIGGVPNWAFFRKRMNAAHVASLHNKRNLFESIGNYDTSFKISADYELLLRKKDKLKYLFVPKYIAGMQIGGMSFSTRAILETYHIRRMYSNLGVWENRLLFIRDWCAFKVYCVFLWLKGKIDLATFFNFLKR